jgi:hypothetical protein
MIIQNAYVSCSILRGKFWRTCEPQQNFLAHRRVVQDICTRSISHRSFIDVGLFRCYSRMTLRCFFLFCFVYNAVSWFIFSSTTTSVHLVLHSKVRGFWSLFVSFAAKKLFSNASHVLFSNFIFSSRRLSLCCLVSLSSIIFVVSIHITSSS